MSEPIDRDGTIFALTEGIGAAFGSASRKSFSEQLERLERLPLFLKQKADQQQSLVDLLAIAAFYQNVIVPIESSGNFISILNRAGATHLRVAKDKLDTEFAGESHMAAQKFRQIIGRSEIPEYLLTYATLKQFAGTAIRHYSQGQK